MSKHARENFDVEKNELTPEGKAKLPAWIVEVVGNMARKLGEVTRQRDELLNGCPGSPVTIREVDTVRTISPRTSVRFELDQARHKFIEVRLDEDRDGRVYVYASDKLVAIASGTNTLSLDLFESFERHEHGPIRDLGQNLMLRAKARGLWFDDLLRLLTEADVDDLKARRSRPYREPTKGGA